jgi:molybdate-binding protein
VRLWDREQGIVLPAGNPDGIRGVPDLVRTTFAHRAPGSGTRALVGRRLRDHGVAAAAVAGPEAPSHLAVAVAVASGTASAGVSVRAAAATLGLDFLPLAWEPFEIALPEDDLGRLEPFLAVLAERGTRARIEALGGYDLAASGTVRRVV